MAGLFVALKLRLVTGALRGSGGARASFIASTVFAALFAIGIFAGLAALRGNSGAVALTTVTFTSLAFGWLILPLMVFGLDSTLDPATLALYPLRTRPLAVGLLAASLTGAWPAANLIGLAGVTVGLAHGAFGIIVAIAAAVGQLLFCVTLARCVTTVLARALHSRRGRDLAALLIIPIFALYEVFAQVVPRMAASGALTPGSFGGVDAWLRWLPPGLAAHAIADASAGRPLAAVLRLAALAVIIVVLGWLWIRSLTRALVTADTSTHGAAVHGGVLRFASAGLTGTVAARFWIYQRRDPSSLLYWALTGVIMVVATISTITTPRYDVGLLLSAVLGGALIGVLHANSIGMNGPAFTLEALALTSRRTLRAYFAGQDLALAAIGVPLIAVAGFVLAGVAGHPLQGVVSLAEGIAAAGGGLALSNIFTVTMAYPAERRPGNPAPRPADGYMGQRVAATLGSVIGTAVIVSPVLIAATLTASAPAAVRMPVLAVCAAAYAVVLAWAGTRIAARLAESRLPELTQMAARTRL